MDDYLRERDKNNKLVAAAFGWLILCVILANILGYACYLQVTSAGNERMTNGISYLSTEGSMGFGVVGAFIGALSFLCVIQPRLNRYLLKKSDGSE